MAMTTTAYPNSVVRRRRVRAPNATRAAEHSTTIPSATAVGGVAAFSAGVRLMGAGGQLVSAISARAEMPQTRTWARAGVGPPPAVRFRVAARARAGINGSTYCGSLD